MLDLSRGYVAYLLMGYGEPEASAAIMRSSDEEFRLVQIAANQAAAEYKLWLKVACESAVAVVEGRRRELRRDHLVTAEMPDHLLGDDRKRAFERSQLLMRGTPVKKPQIMTELSEAIASVLVGYRFFKSRYQFVKPFTGATAFVGLHRGKGAVYFSFGVTHDAIENVERWLFGPRQSGTQGRLYPLTLAVISANISPRNHFWPHSNKGSWLVLYSDGLHMAAAESASFVREVVLPFINYNQSPDAIRNTLSTARGHVASLRPARTLFAIDHLKRRRDWLKADLAMLQERYRHYRPENKDTLQREYETTVQRWDENIGTLTES
jgi:hypothetical protein